MKRNQNNKNKQTRSLKIKKSNSVKVTKQTQDLQPKKVNKTSKVNNIKKMNSKIQKKTRQIQIHQDDFFIQLGQNKWPLERDILFRPDRLKYVRKLIKEDGCVFCNAHTKPQSFDSLCVYQTTYSMILLNKYPYNSGHLLIIPRRHVGELLDLEQDEFIDLQNTIRIAMKALKEIYQPGGMNLGLNNGAVAGAGIPEHLHYHLIPRWFGDLNFFPLIAETKTMVESLEQTYDKMIKYFGGSK